MAIQTCRECQGWIIPVPGHPPRIHPMCAPPDEDWHSAREWQQLEELLVADDLMPTATVVIACGGRHYDDETQVRRYLAGLNRRAVLRHGGASGADALAGRVWKQLGGAVEVFEANWFDPCGRNCTPGHRKPMVGGGTYCPAAGPNRNRRMAQPRNAPKAQLVIAFPGGKGTADMVATARLAGILVRLVPERLVAPKQAEKTRTKPTRRAA